jgi:hypothetical protein
MRRGCLCAVPGTVPERSCNESAPIRTRRRFARAQELAWLHASLAAVFAPSAVRRRSRHRARRRAAADRPRRLRPRRGRPRNPRRQRALRLAPPRVLRPRQPLPPRRRVRTRAPLPRDAPTQLHVRAALQPASRPSRTPISGTLRCSPDRGRGLPRQRLRVRPEQRGTRRTLRRDDPLALERRLSEMRFRRSARCRRRACALRACPRR